MLGKKRLLTAIISLVVGGALLAGCGSKATNATSSTETSSKEVKVIKVGTSGTYYPFTFVEGEKLQGVEIDIWDEIGKRTGYKVEYVKSGFTGLFGLLDTGKIDTIAHQIDINEKRKQKYDFSSAYMYNPLKFAVKKDSNITGLNDLKGKKVAVGIGGNEGEELSKVDKKGEITQVKYGDGSNMFKEAEAGRVDACIVSSATALSAIKKGNLNLKVVGEAVYLETNAYPFARNDKSKDILSKVNKAIEDMHKDGTLSKISQKWFDADITKK